MDGPNFRVPPCTLHTSSTRLKLLLLLSCSPLNHIRLRPLALNSRHLSLYLHQLKRLFHSQLGLTLQLRVCLQWDLQQTLSHHRLHSATSPLSILVQTLDAASHNTQWDTQPDSSLYGESILYREVVTPSDGGGWEWECRDYELHIHTPHS